MAGRIWVESTPGFGEHVLLYDSDGGALTGVGREGWWVACDGKWPVRVGVPESHDERGGGLRTGGGSSRDVVDVPRALLAGGAEPGPLATRGGWRFERDVRVYPEPFHGI